MTKGYTNINNSLLFDLDISCEALGLAIKLISISKIPNFRIRRNYAKSLLGRGEIAFRRVWKELKTIGIVQEKNIRVNGRFDTLYTIQDVTQAPKEKKSIKENKTVKEEIPAEEIFKDENVEEIKKYTGFNIAQVKELLKAAKENLQKIKDSFEYALRNGAKNLYAYTLKVIINGWAYKVKETNEIDPMHFNNFPSREYDWETLERKLLGWDG